MISLKYVIVFFAISGLSHGLKKYGTKNRNARIFNGQDASSNQFPWHVLLVVEFPNVPNANDPNKWHEQTGGGVWISKKHILTCSDIFYPQ